MLPMQFGLIDLGVHMALKGLTQAYLQIDPRYGKRVRANTFPCIYNSDHHHVRKLRVTLEDLRCNPCGIQRARMGRCRIYT